MMNDFETASVGRLAFDGRDVHVFGESGIHENIHNVVGSARRQDVGLFHRHNDIGLANVPLIEIAELAWSRRIRGISHRRACVDPLADRGNIRVAQGRIVPMFAPEAPHPLQISLGCQVPGPGIGKRCHWR